MSQAASSQTANTADQPPGAMPADRSMATQQAYKMCAQIVRERAKNF